MAIAISVEDLAKNYKLGQISTGTFAQDLAVWWAKVRGKPNPMLKIGQTEYGDSKNQDLWALRDVNFIVKQGEVLGIIGQNGAGKSTLLKIISRVTAPTNGRICVKGRIASLLEVGTGFHPELTGRENIFLNGAIMGMEKREIRKKFDEIVEFAEVEKFVDTPVKRYSSGMYVRLAFAVAAHLDPEILVLDEVLAVGDAAFQRKCLGKMGKVAKEGRTILFVSHNMAAVKMLCSRSIFLKNGNIIADGDTREIIRLYDTNLDKIISTNRAMFPLINANFGLKVNDCVTELKEVNGGLQPAIRIYLQADQSLTNLGVGISIKNADGAVVSLLAPYVTGLIIERVEGLCECTIYCNDISKYLSGGSYIIGFWLAKPKIEFIIKMDELAKIELAPIDIFGNGVFFEERLFGPVPLPIKMEIKQEAN